MAHIGESRIELDFVASNGVVDVLVYVGGAFSTLERFYSASEARAWADASCPDWSYASTITQAC